MDGVLGLDLANSAEKILSDEKNPVQAENHADDPESAEIDSLVAERTEAKKAKNFARADEIRSILSARGISIIDTPRGTSWTRK
jgi:cysteinyl-tRNA synthetase